MTTHAARAASDAATRSVVRGLAGETIKEWIFD
jgi:hypothetical protein